MRSYLKINTTEAGKTMSMVAGVPQVITLCNIEVFNTDKSTFTYNAETGEITILRRGLMRITGSFCLIEPISVTADLSIMLLVNGTPMFEMYSGTSNHRTLASFSTTFSAGDVISFELTDQSTEDIETATDSEQFITMQRIS